MKTITTTTTTSVEVCLWTQPGAVASVYNTTNVSTGVGCEQDDGKTTLEVFICKRGKVERHVKWTTRTTHNQHTTLHYDFR